VNILRNSYGSIAPYNRNSEGTFKNQLSVVDWIYSDAGKQPFGYFVYDIPGVTYSMDYMMWWVGKTKYHYVTQSSKQPITYLILFPFKAGDLNAHVFWMTHTVRTEGKLLAKKKFSSGIEVRKLGISPDEPPPHPNYFQNLIFR